MHTIGRICIKSRKGKKPRYRSTRGPASKEYKLKQGIPLQQILSCQCKITETKGPAQSDKGLAQRRVFQNECNARDMHAMPMHHVERSYCRYVVRRFEVKALRAWIVEGRSPVLIEVGTALKWGTAGERRGVMRPAQHQCES